MRIASLALSTTIIGIFCLHLFAAHAAKYLGQWFGWKPDNIIDLGDITAARGTEMMMPLWMRLFQGVIGHPYFNYHIVRGN